MHQERERADILEQYRSLSQTAEKFETQAHHLESEGSNLKLELRTRDGEVRRLKEKVESLERQLEEVCFFPYLYLSVSEHLHMQRVLCIYVI